MRAGMAIPRSAPCHLGSHGGCARDGELLPVFLAKGGAGSIGQKNLGKQAVGVHRFQGEMAALTFELGLADRQPEAEPLLFPRVAMKLFERADFPDLLLGHPASVIPATEVQASLALFDFHLDLRPRFGKFERIGNDLGHNPVEAAAAVRPALDRAQDEIVFPPGRPGELGGDPRDQQAGIGGRCGFEGVAPGTQREEQNIVERGFFQPEGGFLNEIEDLPALFP